MLQVFLPLDWLLAIYPINKKERFENESNYLP